MSGFATAADEDEKWPDDLPCAPRAGGPHVAVLISLLAEGIALIGMGDWAPVAR